MTEGGKGQIIPLTGQEPRTVKCPHCDGFGLIQVCRVCGLNREAPAMPGCPEGFHHMKLSGPKGMRADRAVY